MERSFLKRRHGHSVLWQHLVGVVLTAAGILALYILFMHLVDNVYVSEILTPPIYIIEDYADALEQEAYDSIPLSQMTGNAFEIYDEQGNTIYQSNSILDIPYETADFLFRATSDESADSIYILGAFYEGDRFIMANRYQTVEGKERLILELIPFETLINLESAAENARTLRIVGVLCCTAWIALMTLLFSWRFRRMLRPVDDAILSYQNGVRPDMEGKVIPLELQGVLDDLNNMLNRIDQARLEQLKAEQSRNKMIADLSHDLKTPLTVISGYSGAMLDGVVAEADWKAYLKTIHQKADYTSGLMDELFAYSKMEHPDYVLHKETVDYGEFCREYLAEKYQELDLAGFLLHVEIPEEPLLHSIDKALYRRVLENLVTNCQKHNPPGTNLYFRVTQEHNRLVTIVADDGVGIAEKVAAHLFEPFVKGDEARATGQGTGLGMAVAKKIVELHDGTIELVNPPEGAFRTEIRIRL